MKLLITGSRNITNFDLSGYISDDVKAIISFNNKGIDRIAAEYADYYGIPKLIFDPDCEKSESRKNYDEIIMMCDSVLIIWDGKSQDVIPTIRCVNKHTKPVKIFLHRG